MTMKRRDALKTIGGLAGAASMARFLPGCGGEGERPMTYVFLMMETRSYDHLMGARALEGLPGDGQRPGFANPDRNGQMVSAFAAQDDRGTPTASVCDLDPPHSWGASHEAFN